MIPAVGDHPARPAADHERTDRSRARRGGVERPITFAKQRFDAPRVGARPTRRTDAAIGRVDVSSPRCSSPTRRRSSRRCAIPAETGCPACRWSRCTRVALTGTMVTASDVDLAKAAWEIAAVLTSPFASAWLWHRGAGSGLSANTVRSSPVVLADLPWPSWRSGRRGRRRSAGDVEVVRDLCRPRLRHRRRHRTGASWWTALLDSIEARQPVGAAESARPPATLTPVRGSAIRRFALGGAITALVAVGASCGGGGGVVMTVAVTAVVRRFRTERRRADRPEQRLRRMPRTGLRRRGRPRLDRPRRLRGRTRRRHHGGRRRRLPDAGHHRPRPQTCRLGTRSRCRRTT